MRLVCAANVHRRIQHVDQRPLADRQAVKVMERPGQPLEGDAVRVAQVDHQRPQVRPERRARRHVGWRGSLEPPASADNRHQTASPASPPAGPAAARRDHRPRTAFAAPRHIPLAMRAARSLHLKGLRWVRIKSAMAAGTAFLRRLPLGLDVSLEALRLCEGGTLELSGVFGGRPSLASDPRSASSTARSPRPAPK